MSGQITNEDLLRAIEALALERAKALLTAQEVADMLGWSRAKVYYMAEHSAAFPAPVVDEVDGDEGKRATRRRWRTKEVLAYVDSLPRVSRAV